ncbi:MAG: domain S-box protein [Flaviaesturariibacter sp.]|nr:domain S-box protein [Flaviaesturariibacter sp.]
MPSLPDQITEHKPLALSYEATLFHGTNIIEHIQDILITTDLDFKIRTFNKVAETYYGFKEAEVQGKQMSKVVQFEFLSTTIGEAIVELQEKGSWNGEVSFTNRHGATYYFSHTITYLFDTEGNRTGVLDIGRDITLQRQTQQHLLQSEKFYRGLIADSLDGIILTNVQGLITFASPSVRNILGFEPDEVTGTLTFDYVHPDDREWTMQSFEREVHENPEIKFLVVRLLKKSGEWLWCMLRAHNMLSNPYVAGIAVHFHDDSLRKKASEALKESEQRFRSLVRDLRIGILMQNAEGNILLSNNTMSRMMGTTEMALLGKKIWEIYPDAINESGQALSKEDRPIYKALTTRKQVRDQVMGVQHPLTGQRIWMLLNADPIMNNEGDVVSILCSFMDITERKKLEQKILADKLSHQRQLTQASIDSQERERREIGKELHDNIGQQLTTIKLFLDLAKSSADESTAEMIALAVRNVSDVINEVRSLSRSLVPSTLGDLGLIESIKDLSSMINRVQRIQVSFFSAFFNEEKVQENHKLMLYRIVQEQLNNIVKHAEASVVIVHLQNDGGELVLEITDDGKGFDEKTVKRGLGLTNMRNRAETLGGSFEIVSAPGEGCTVRVSVPEVEEPAEKED